MKEFGTKELGTILMVDEEKLTLDLIEQVRNYLTAKEKEIKKIDKSKSK